MVNPGMASNSSLWNPEIWGSLCQDVADHERFLWSFLQELDMAEPAVITCVSLNKSNSPKSLGFISLENYVY